METPASCGEERLHPAVRLPERTTREAPEIHAELPERGPALCFESHYAIGLQCAVLFNNLYRIDLTVFGIRPYGYWHVAHFRR